MKLNIEMDAETIALVIEAVRYKAFKHPGSKDRAMKTRYLLARLLEAADVFEREPVKSAIGNAITVDEEGEGEPTISNRIPDEAPATVPAGFTGLTPAVTGEE